MNGSDRKIVFHTQPEHLSKQTVDVGVPTPAFVENRLGHSTIRVNDDRIVAAEGSPSPHTKHRAYHLFVINPLTAAPEPARGIRGRYLESHSAGPEPARGSQYQN